MEDDVFRLVFWFFVLILCLENRERLPININPCFVFQDDPSPIRNEQVTRAASLIDATLWFVSLLKGGLLEPDRERQMPLCMYQYSKLFGTTRFFLVFC